MAKRFKQIRIPSPDIVIDYNNGWSNNLLNTDEMITEITIQATPNTVFQFNQNNPNELSTLTIDSMGFFQLNTINRPISALYLKQMEQNPTELNPITIDLTYYLGGGIDKDQNSDDNKVVIINAGGTITWTKF